MLKHEIPHQLDLPTVVNRIDEAFAHYKERFAKYQPMLLWLGTDRAEFGFSARGLSLTGVLAVTPQAVLIAMDVPLLLRMFRGRAIEAVDREAARWLTRPAASPAS